MSAKPGIVVRSMPQKSTFFITSSADGLPLKNTVPAGDEVHLYAQWKNVKKSKKQKG